MIHFKNQRPFYFLFFSFVILLKFIFLRYTLYSTILPIWALLVEISAIVALFTIFEWIKNNKIKLLSYFLVDLILSVLAFACIVYHHYFQTIPTVFAFSSLGQVGAVGDSISNIIKPIYFILFLDFLFLALYPLWKNKIFFKSKSFHPIPLIITFFLFSSITITQYKATKNTFIADTLYFTQENGVMNYEYLMLKQFLNDNLLNKSTTAFSNVDLEEVNALKNEILELKGITLKAQEDLQYFGIGENKNLIIIQMESFANLFIGMEVDGQEVTPFINQLKNEMLYFSNMYQQVYGGNTSDSEIMVTTSYMPNFYEPTSMKFGNKVYYDSLPNQLNDLNYTTLTAHTNTSTFWNRNMLYPGLGFSDFYDKEFFQDEDFIMFGSSDQVLFEKTLPELLEIKEKNQNFYIQYVTASSHYPYTIPKEKHYLDLPSDIDGSFLGNMLQAMRYLDSTIEYFVNELKANGLWENSVLVMYGDHSAFQATDLEKEHLAFIEDSIGTTYNDVRRFNIPLLIYDSSIQPAEVTSLVSQLDIMPTVANIMGLDLSDKIIFGQDVINYPENIVGYQYYVPSGTFYTEEFYFTPKTGFHDGTAIDLLTGMPYKKDLSMYEAQYNNLLSLYALSYHHINGLPFQTTSDKKDILE